MIYYSDYSHAEITFLNCYEIQIFSWSLLWSVASRRHDLHHWFQCTRHRILGTRGVDGFRPARRLAILPKRQGFYHMHLCRLFMHKQVKTFIYTNFSKCTYGCLWLNSYIDSLAQSGISGLLKLFKKGKAFRTKCSSWLASYTIMLKITQLSIEL